MPQINLYTFLGQCSWTIILFLYYYVIMKQSIIPSILENIIIKSKYIKSTNNNYWIKDLKTNAKYF